MKIRLGESFPCYVTKILADILRRVVSFCLETTGGLPTSWFLTALVQWKGCCDVCDCGDAPTAGNLGWSCNHTRLCIGLHLRQQSQGVEEECRAQGIAFLPIVAESLGGWHNVAEREVKKLGAALARHTGQDEGEAISHLWGRLGVLLQRGNAAILGNRVPAFPGAIVDGLH